MPSGFQSTLLLTVLLAIGLVFFLRAASKDRTTVVDVHSPQPALDVLNGINDWLELRGWIRDGGDAERQVLRFRGSVAASRPLHWRQPVGVVSGWFCANWPPNCPGGPCC